MYKEFKFQDPIKAAKKQQELQNTYGYKFPVYEIQTKTTHWLSVVYPVGLQPNPKKRR